MYVHVPITHYSATYSVYMQELMTLQFCMEARRYIYRIILVLSPNHNAGHNYVHTCTRTYILLVWVDQTRAYSIVTATHADHGREV